MNQSFYGNQGFPGNPIQVPNQSVVPTTGAFDVEQSYIENILRLNKGKKVKVYMTFTDSTEWRDRIFDGIVEQAGRDHLIISDPQTGKWYLLQMIYLDYVEFEERINYSPEFIPNL